MPWLGLGTVISDDYLIYKVSRANTQETHRAPAFLQRSFLKGEQTTISAAGVVRRRRQLPGTQAAILQLNRWSGSRRIPCTLRAEHL